MPMTPPFIDVSTSFMDGPPPGGVPAVPLRRLPGGSRDRESDGRVRESVLEKPRLVLPTVCNTVGDIPTVGS